MTGQLPRRLLHEWFIAGLAMAPDRVALRIGRQEWTYTELDQVARRWAGGLVACGARSVGILAVRSIESYAGLLATLYAGATAVPLSPGFPAARTCRMAAQAGVDTVIVDRSGAAALAHLTAALPGLTVAAQAATPLAALPRAGYDDVAYVLFTSGSTGRPKGAAITHANMDSFLRYNLDRYDLGPGDVCSQTFDQTFDLAMFDLFVAWGAGATVVSTPPQVFTALPEFLAAERVTFWFSVPSAIALVRRRGGLTPGSMPTLRWSLFCGEALRMTDAEDWQRAAAGSVVENLYGPTELTIACSAHRLSGDSADLAVHGVVPIGAPYPHLRYRIVEDGVDGTEGELCVTGEQMFPGYLDPADDEGRFHDGDSVRWYRTGDRVRECAGGELVYLGRVDRQVKVRGYRVELDELEWHVGQLPGVERAVAVAFEAAGRTELAVFYVGTPGVDIRRPMSSILPGYMVPLLCRDIDAFPHTANGKIDRGVLAARARDLVAGGQVTHA
ncbi:AMP-binding protein [Micromonospora sp. NPDC049060]|uniref:AMP-binding protein n=1 Tax=unclassified Micromonospora TaxID=2617518 RepID=UPI0033D43911